MAQNYTTDCFSTAHVIETDMQNVENNFECLRTLFSGSTAPSSPIAYQLWANSSDSKLYIRTTNSSWHTMWDVGQDCVPAGKVKTTSIASNAITSAHISASAVTGAAIGASAVMSSHLADGAVQGVLLHTSGAGYPVAYGAGSGHTNGSTTITWAHFPNGGKCYCYFYNHSAGNYVRIYRNSSLIYNSNTTGWTGYELTLNSTGGNYVALSASLGADFLMYGYIYQGVSGAAAFGDLHYTMSSGSTVPAVCFFRDAMVMMANGEFKPIAELIPGDVVVGINGGTNKVIRLHKTILGRRRLLSLKGGLKFSDDHPLWIRNGKEGWGSHNLPQVMRTKEYQDISVMPISGVQEFGHVDGWKKQKAFEVTASPWTELFSPHLDGDHTLIVNGYKAYGL